MRRLRPVTLALLIGAGAMLSTRANAFDGEVLQFPVPLQDGSRGYSPNTGLRLDLDYRWFNGGGYRPIRVRVESKNTSTVDRQIRVRFSFRRAPRFNRPPSMVVDHVLQLAAGQSTVETLALCPAPSEWASMWWEFRVDGQPDPALSTSSWKSAPFTGGRPSRLRVMYPVSTVDSPADSIEERRGEVVRRGRRGRRARSTEAVCERFDTWLGYSAGDIAQFTLTDLRALAADEAQGLAALRQWVLSGGTVWVVNAGDSPEGFAEIDALLGLGGWRLGALEDEREAEAPLAGTAARVSVESTAPDDDSTSGESPAPVGQDAEARSSKRKPVPVDGAPGWAYVSLVDQPSPQEAVQRIAEDGLGVLLSLNDKNSKGWYAQRDAGFGRVLAFKGAPGEAPSEIADDRAAVGTGQNDWFSRNWANRHGIEPGTVSSEFGTLMIPGVGVAPVNEFQVLITLFVLVIGPLNYWLLWRKQQLQLLVVTTPLCALLVTAGMFAYASLSDGFGVKARVRSVTLLNQSSGEAVNWSRVSHYVSSMPERPAEFPSDTAVYPIEPAWGAALNTSDGGTREVEFASGKQELLAGWTPTRAAFQHLVVRSRETDARIGFLDEGGAMKASNRLGAPIDLLVVRDEAGDWRFAHDLDDGASATLTATDRIEAVRSFRSRVIDNLPEFPIGAGKALEETMERLGNARAVRKMQRETSSTLLRANLLNRWVEDLSGMSGSRSLDFPPRTYVAVASQAFETPLGWDEVEEVGSFHVIVGKW